jgi:cysteine synthase B
MPDNMSSERQMTMRAYGAEIILVSKEAGMMGARDLAEQMQTRGEGKRLDQFANADNPRAHYESTGPEIWLQTEKTITHFVSSMGTTGTIMGCAKYFGEVNPDIQIIGVQPEEGASIPGIRCWPKAYLPKIYDAGRVHRIIRVSQHEAEETMRKLAIHEGIFCGVSSGGAVSAALRLSEELESAHIVTVICDRGDRYLSTGVYE